MHHMGSPNWVFCILCYLRLALLERAEATLHRLYLREGGEDFCSVGIGNREYREEGDTSGEDADIPQPHTRRCLLLTGPSFASWHYHSGAGWSWPSGSSPSSSSSGPITWGSTHFHDFLLYFRYWSEWLLPAPSCQPFYPFQTESMQKLSYDEVSIHLQIYNSSMNTLLDQRRSKIAAAMEVPQPCVSTPPPAERNKQPSQSF